MKDLIREISQWPLWAKLGVIAGAVLLGLVNTILEDPAVAFRNWIGDFLAKQHLLSGWDLLGIGIVALILGVLTVLLLQKTGLVSSSTSSTPAPTVPEQGSTVATTVTPREEAAVKLNEMLNELAVGKTAFLPEILGNLRLIFDILGKREDADWCATELNGYTPESTPEYRHADATVTWRSGGVTTSTEVARRPPDQPMRLPLPDPVGTLLRKSQKEWREPTGESTQDLMGQKVREVVIVKAEAVQDVLRRILEQCYQRAVAARQDLEAS